MEYKYLNVQPEEVVNIDDVYITHLQRKGKLIHSAIDLLDFRSDQLHRYKTKFTKHLQNKPIKLPIEDEDMKSHKQHPKHGTHRQSCEQKVPTQQMEDVNQLADEFQTNNIQYAVNGSILVKSMRGELLLTRNHNIYSKSCIESSDVSTKTSSTNNSSGNEQNKSDASMEGHSSSDKSSDDENGNIDSEDDGNESDEETGSENNSVNLIISAQDVRNSMFDQYCLLNAKERTYLEHFEHAYKCDGNCELQQCMEPGEIVNFCNNIIMKNPKEEETEQHGMFSKVLIHHAIGCSRRADECKMVICQHFEAITTEIDNSSHVRSTEPYSVILSNTTAISEDMREGYDFSLMFIDLKGNGSFGEVFDACYYDKRGTQARVAVKSIKNKKNFPRIDDSIECMKKLGAFENILLPDLILKNSESYLFLMQCAETSLLKYIKMVAKPNQELDLNFCCFYFFQMAKGLNYCHSKGFVHGDIKPANAVVTAGYRVLKLIDWDFLKDRDAPCRGSGSPGYFAPEVVDGEVVQGSDVFSLCRSLIPLLFANENPLVVEVEQQKLHGAIRLKNEKLAEIYTSGTQIEYINRLSAESICNQFRSDEELRQLSFSYRPIYPHPDEGSEDNDYHACYRFFRNWMMRRLDDFSDVIPEFEEISPFEERGEEEEDVKYQFMEISSSDDDGEEGGD